MIITIIITNTFYPITNNNDSAQLTGVAASQYDPITISAKDPSAALHPHPPTF